MPMTAEQIIKEASHWPREQVADLVERLTISIHADIDPKIDQAWKTETRRRLAELENGKVQPISGEVVSARVRQIIGR